MSGGRPSVLDRQPSHDRMLRLPRGNLTSPHGKKQNQVRQG